MKVLHIAYSLSESSAAVRFAKMLESNNIGNQYFLLGRISNHDFVRKKQINPQITNIIGIISHLTNIIFQKLFLKNENDIFSFGFINPISKIFFNIFFFKNKFDLILLHWGGYNFFPIELLNYSSIGKKSVIFFHDYYYITGGCHVPMNCPEYVKNCKNCPVSKNYLSKKWISKEKNIKKSIIEKYNIPLVTLSNYSHNFIKINNNNKVIVIPNTIGEEYQFKESNVEIYYQDYINNRRLNLNIPTILIIGIKFSQRNNKGTDLLLNSLIHFKKYNCQINIITQGEFIDLSEFGSQIHFKILSNIELKNLYTTADLTLLPSKYETFSQVTLESILSFTPVVAFDLTGPVDIIINGQTGFLVPAFNTELFAKNIFDNLNFKINNFKSITKFANNTFEKYSNKKVFFNFNENIIKHEK